MGIILDTINQKARDKAMRLPNTVFPQWITANVILIGEIAPRLGVYPSAEDGRFKIVFLPYEAFLMVPPEDRDTFREKYQQFVVWSIQNVFGTEFFDRYLYDFCDQRLFVQMGYDVRQKIEVYDHSHYPTYQRKFLEYMGIDPIVSVGDA